MKRASLATVIIFNFRLLGATLRHRTGLRNRYRSGKGTYSKERKSRRADLYGTFEQGRVKTQDTIAGRVMWAVRSDGKTQAI